MEKIKITKFRQAIDDQSRRLCDIAEGLTIFDAEKGFISLTIKKRLLAQLDYQYRSIINSKTKDYEYLAATLLKFLTLRDGYAHDFCSALEDKAKEICDLLELKNNQYGGGIFKLDTGFANIPVSQRILSRMDDKVRRIVDGDGTGDEDAFMDLLGYLILYLIVIAGYNHFEESKI